MASPATETGQKAHKVTVPSPEDMDTWTFQKHVQLRHFGIWRTIGASRVHHDTAHRCMPRGLLDHTHLPAVEREPALPD